MSNAGSYRLGFFSLKAIFGIGVQRFTKKCSGAQAKVGGELLHKPDRSPVFGVVLRIQSGGYGVVKLDRGDEAFFDRFGVSGRSVHLYGKLRTGDKIVAEAETLPGGIVRLHSVGHA